MTAHFIIGIAMGILKAEADKLRESSRVNCGKWKLLGFLIGRGDKQGIIDALAPKGTNNYERIETATIPFWAVWVLSASRALSLALQAFRRGRLATQGQCVCCGHDLRATPDRCPECGTVAPKILSII